MNEKDGSPRWTTLTESLNRTCITTRERGQTLGPAPARDEQSYKGRHKRRRSGHRRVVDRERGSKVGSKAFARIKALGSVVRCLVALDQPAVVAPRNIHPLLHIRDHLR